MTFDPDQLAEDAAFEKIRKATSESLSEMLCEIGGYSDSRRPFMELLAQIRGGDHAGIGYALMQCLFDEAIRGIDGDELAHRAEEDARRDAYDSRRDAREFNRLYP